MGVIQGYTDRGYKYSPALYWERLGGACQNPIRDWNFVSQQYNPDYPEIDWNGQYVVCDGRHAYKYDIRRMGGGPPYHTVQMYSALSVPTAGSEPLVFTSPSYLEHNGIQCFGTFSNCSGQFGLWLFQWYGGYWEYWGTGRATVIRDADTNDPPGCCPGYYHDPIVQWSSFKTRSTW